MLKSASETTLSQWPASKALTYTAKPLCWRNLFLFSSFGEASVLPYGLSQVLTHLQGLLQSKQTNHLQAKDYPRALPKLELHCPWDCLETSKSCSEGTHSPWNTCAGCCEEEVRMLGLTKFLIDVISLLRRQNMGRKPRAGCSPSFWVRGRD